VFKRVLDINFERGYTNLKILSKIRYQLKKPSFNTNLKDYMKGNWAYTYFLNDFGG
jgi:hypothetical protein